MRPNSGKRLINSLFHVAISVVGLGTGTAAWAQGQPAAVPQAPPNKTSDLVISGQGTAQPPSAEYTPQGTTPRGQQEGPGVPEYYRSQAAALPSYYYQSWYYDRSGIGARALADYAPRG